MECITYHMTRQTEMLSPHFHGSRVLLSTKLAASTILHCTTARDAGRSRDRRRRDISIREAGLSGFLIGVGAGSRDPWNLKLFGIGRLVFAILLKATVLPLWAEPASARSCSGTAAASWPCSSPPCPGPLSLRPRPARVTPLTSARMFIIYQVRSATSDVM